jgi:hypothetical protein
MSLRTITKQQFSDGTTIDGNRIEQALQELEEICDQVPGYYVKRRFVQSQITVGFTPFQKAPYNDQVPALSGGGFITGITTNIERWKGYKILSQPIADVDKVVFWETSFMMNNPGILHALDCFMVQPTGSPTPTYQLPGGASSPYSPPDVSDVQLFAVVDSPFVGEDRSQSDVLIHKYGMDMAAWRITPIPRTSSTHEMVPAYPGGTDSGWALTLDNLNLPLPELARVRIALAIPTYKAATTGRGQWGDTPWTTFIPSLTATLLEPLSHV